ncbi:MAG TPA: hypothetical protein VK699_16500 [Terriglobales bacterium]|nr:hypothetical protein [Terriglobales bacterium]
MKKKKNAVQAGKPTRAKQDWRKRRTAKRNRVTRQEQTKQEVAREPLRRSASAKPPTLAVPGITLSKPLRLSIPKLDRPRPLKLSVPKLTPAKRPKPAVSRLAPRKPAKLPFPKPPKRGRLWVAPDLHVLLRGPQGNRGIPLPGIEGHLELAERMLKGPAVRERFEDIP